MFDERVNIGIQSDQPGWGYFDGQRRSGFDYDFANWLANELNLAVAFVHLKPGEREQMLKDRKVDLVIATYSKTDSRTNEIAFAGPYMLTRQGVLVRSADKRIRTSGDLADKLVCAVAGTTSMEQLNAMGIDVSEEVGHGVCVDRLIKGEVDAVSTDQTVLRGWAKRVPGLRVVDGLTFGHQERYGVGIRHGEVEQCKALTGAIKEFIVRGEWNTLFRNNVGEVESVVDYRPDPTLLDRCE